LQLFGLSGEESKKEGRINSEEEFEMDGVIKIEDLKLGGTFAGERIIHTKDMNMGKIIVFKTCSENFRGPIEKEYCGDRDGEFLSQILLTKKYAVRYYKWGDSCPLRIEEENRQGR
jgi:hypothetical protein